MCLQEYNEHLLVVVDTHGTMKASLAVASDAWMSAHKAVVLDTGVSLNSTAVSVAAVGPDGALVAYASSASSAPVKVIMLHIDRSRRRCVCVCVCGGQGQDTWAICCV